jgi:hypothetical protein
MALRQDNVLHTGQQAPHKTTFEADLGLSGKKSCAEKPDMTALTAATTSQQASLHKRQPAAGNASAGGLSST